MSDDIAEDLVCATCGAARRDGSWCPRCLELYERPVEPSVEHVFMRAPRMYSRSKPGPMSFGLGGRISFSIIPVVVAFFAVRNVMRSRHDVTVGYYLVLAVPTLVIVAGFLAYVWKRERIS